jgi:hypothetical protein
MLMSSLTCLWGFSVKFSVQLIYTDYANYGYFNRKMTLKSSPRKPLIQMKPLDLDSL